MTGLQGDGRERRKKGVEKGENGTGEGDRREGGSGVNGGWRREKRGHEGTMEGGMKKGGWRGEKMGMEKGEKGVGEREKEGGKEKGGGRGEKRGRKTPPCTPLSNHWIARQAH